MKQVLVIGAARSGVAVAHLLHRQGYDVTITDMQVIANKQALEAIGVHVLDQGHPDALRHTNWEFIVKNPGIKYTVPFVKYFVEQALPIYTEVEIAYRYAKHFRFGAITGTNGKTTITTMLYEMLKYNQRALVAGNIGYPLSQLAMDHETEVKDVALELSNFQLLGIETFRPCVSVVCNLAPDHLDYMGSVEAYYASKMQIYKNCQEDDWFLRNVDDTTVLAYALDIPCTVIDFSMHRQDVDLYRKDGAIYLHDTLLFKESGFHLAGNYNLSNAMIAACMAYKMGVSIAHIQEALENIQPVEHRLEYVGEKQGVRFYNDSKATNTHAVEAALASFENNIILLAGGYDKKLPFTALQQFNERVKLCVSFGETRMQFKEVFTHVHVEETMQHAFEYALRHAKKGDVVLLSPACASYDQFPNYEERGVQFKQLVNTYLDEN